jgi:hypothetical protein
MRSQRAISTATLLPILLAISAISAAQIRVPRNFPTIGFGMATDTKATGNKILGGDRPIWKRTGVTGTKLHGNCLSR